MNFKGFVTNARLLVPARQNDGENAGVISTSGGPKLRESGLLLHEAVESYRELHGGRGRYQCGWAAMGEIVIAHSLNTQIL